MPREIGYRGTELREEINGDPQQLARFERIRVAGALRMGLIKTPEEAATRQHTPKIAFVAPPRDSPHRQRQAGGGRRYRPAGPRAVHGQAAPRDDGYRGGGYRHRRSHSRHPEEPAAGGGERRRYASAIPPAPLRVGAEASQANGEWTVTKAIMSRSARILMEGWCAYPATPSEPIDLPRPSATAKGRASCSHDKKTIPEPA